jgi:hypothetical protein
MVGGLISCVAPELSFFGDPFVVLVATLDPIEGDTVDLGVNGGGKTGHVAAQTSATSGRRFLTVGIG